MAGSEVKSFFNPDEVRAFENGEVSLVHLSDGTVGLATMQPGWSWHASVKPIAKTEWCQERHVGYTLSGRLHVKMATGEEYEIGPNEVGVIAPGHDAWVVGDEPFVSLDWSGMENFARPNR